MALRKLSKEQFIGIKKDLKIKDLKDHEIAAKWSATRFDVYEIKKGAEFPTPKVKTTKPLKTVVELTDQNVAAAIEEDRAVAALKIKSKNVDKKYNYLLRELELADERLKVAYAIKDKITPIAIPAPRKHARGNATAIALASDWHCGEVVLPETVSFLNEYNPAIAEVRARNYFKNLLKLIETQRHSVEIDTLCLWLGGDIITGYIHEELMESNSMSPIEECLFAQDLISGGIKFLLKEGGFKKILVPCSYGNHGRTTPKKRIATGYKNSYEWGLYNNLARYFEGESKVQFSISNGYFNYLEIYNRVLRFHHGDNIGYGGGIGGMAIPLNKFIARSNQQRVADLDFIGHFHQLQQSTQFTVNGSLIGFGAYAQSLGASPEPAQQAFKLLDAKRGFTVSAPIQVIDESERYGQRRLRNEH